MKRKVEKVRKPKNLFICSNGSEGYDFYLKSGERGQQVIYLYEKPQNANYWIEGITKMKQIRDWLDMAIEYASTKEKK